MPPSLRPLKIIPLGTCVAIFLLELRDELTKNGSETFIMFSEKEIGVLIGWPIGVCIDIWRPIGLTKTKLEKNVKWAKT